MNPLQNQIVEMAEQLDILQSSSKNKIAMEEYAVIIDRLYPVSEELKSQSNDRKTLGHLPTGHLVVKVTDDEMEHVEKAIFFINQFLDKWNEDDYKARQDDSLDNTRQAITTLINNLSNTNRETWNEWLNHLVDRFETADAALDSQKDVPGLQQVIQEYREKRDEYYVLTSSIPSTSMEISKISTLVEELESLRGNMDFNLPDEVKRFFENISSAYSGHQVPLTLLTSEITQWLTEKDELKNFVVKRKGMH